MRESDIKDVGSMAFPTEGRCFILHAENNGGYNLRYSLLPSLDDSELLHLSKTNSEAVNILMVKYAPLVKARARAYFLAGADRDDLVQEGMIGLYKAIRDYRCDMASFSAFAELCITRQIISAIKSANRQKHRPLNSYVSLSRPVFGEDDDNEFIDFCLLEQEQDPESIVMDKEQTNALRTAIGGRLSHMERQVLQRYISGIPYSDIAADMGISEKSVDNALQRIKCKLASIRREH